MTRPYRVVVRDAVAERATWLEARKQFITASEAAAFLGKNPWSSPERALDDKCGVRRFFGNKKTEVGQAFEEPIRRLWGQRYGVRSRACQALLQSVRYPWLGATPDAIALVPEEGYGVADIKYSQSIRQRGFPEYYRIQVEVQMLVTGYPRGWLVNFWEWDFDIVQYEWDQRRMDWIVKGTRAAWAEVERKRGSQDVK